MPNIHVGYVASWTYFTAIILCVRPGNARRRIKSLPYKIGEFHSKNYKIPLYKVY